MTALNYRKIDRFFSKKDKPSSLHRHYLCRNKKENMKKVIIASAVLLMAAAACGQKKSDSNVLVAYFSATGTTEAVAKDVAAVTGGTLYEIKPEVAYTAEDLDWRNQESRSSVEMKDKSSRPAFIKDLKDPASYDVIYIGFPVWWYTAPTIINSFLEAYDFSGKTVVFFATSGGSSIDKANEDFKAAYPSINWKAGKTLNGASTADIKAWIDTL